MMAVLPLGLPGNIVHPRVSMSNVSKTCHNCTPTGDRILFQEELIKKYGGIPTTVNTAPPPTLPGMDNFISPGSPLLSSLYYVSRSDYSASGVTGHIHTYPGVSDQNVKSTQGPILPTQIPISLDGALNRIYNNSLPPISAQPATLSPNNIHALNGATKKGSDDILSFSIVMGMLLLAHIYLWGPLYAHNI